MKKNILVSHAPDSDSWCNTVKKAIQVAGDQMGVTVEYRNPPTGDLADMAHIIEQAAASKPAGLVTPIAFAIDQQPFLQGYMPVVILTNPAGYGAVSGTDINSGPGFVTKDSIALVEQLAGEYR